jgi:Na+-translocating ferredoxin:NAD+ oxidoreductase subunit A
MEYIIIIISSLFVSNVVLSQFLGICSFLGVSNKISSAIGMGAAVIFVMALANLISYIVQVYVLNPLHIEFMQTVTFILVIAFLVQAVEIILKKVSPPLFQALGIYIPLITTNCAPLGIAILAIQKNYNMLESVVYGASMAVGYTLALLLMAGMREQLQLVKVPKAMEGFPLTLVIGGLLAMAFMGFAGIVKP